MQKQRTEEIELRPYTKPELQEVELRLDEMVLSGCKADTGGHPGKKNGRCNAGIQCLSSGS